MERLSIQNQNKKLDCEAFSFIDLWNPAVHFEGKEVEVYDNSVSPARYKGRAVYAIVSEFKLYQLKPGAAMLDTGYNLDETLNIIRTMYKNKITDFDNQRFAYCILRKLKEKPQQITLQL